MGENGGATKTGYGYSGSLEYAIIKKLSIGAAVSYLPFNIKTDNIESDFESLFVTMAEQYNLSDPNIQMNTGYSNKITNFGLYLKYSFLNSP